LPNQFTKNNQLIKKGDYEINGQYFRTLVEIFRSLWEISFYIA